MIWKAVIKTKQPLLLLMDSGGYSNLGAQGKDFQKLIFSKKEKEL